MENMPMKKKDSIMNYSGHERLNKSRPRPVLMIPLRRCGSHAVRLRLNASAAFYSPYPLHIVDFLPLVPLYGDMADDRTYFKLILDVIGLQAASLVKWPDIVFDPDDVFDRIKDEKRSVHRIVWELLILAGEKHGARVVMDKSLDSVHFASELMDLFDDLLFINLVRDPRAQVASMNRAIIHDFDTTLNAMTWARAHEASQALVERHPDRVLTIRYEEFLENQRDFVERICAFIGLDVIPEMFDVETSSEAQILSKRSDLWTFNRFAPIAANKDKFLAQLSLDEIRMIETLTRDHMARYGYDRMTDANALLPDEATLAELRAKSATGREQAWRTMSTVNFRDYETRKHRENYIASLHHNLKLPSMALFNDGRRAGHG